MADNIDFGDPINFSPTQKKPTVAQAINPVNRGASDGVMRKEKLLAPRHMQKAASSIQREPVHTVKNIAPIFPRTSGVITKAPSFPAKPGFDGKPPLTPEAAMHAEIPTPKKRNVLMILGVVFVVVLILVGIGYFVFTKLQKPTTQTTNVNQTSQVANTTNTTTTPTINDPTGDPDGDALTNQEEARYGTDANNPDSDGDTFKDGAEVEKGFNPLGVGKLQNPQP